MQYIKNEVDMNIGIHSLSSLSSLNETILPPITSHHNRICLIAVVALAFLAACYYAMRYYDKTWSFLLEEKNMKPVESVIKRVLIEVISQTPAREDKVPEVGLESVKEAIIIDLKNDQDSSGEVPGDEKIEITKEDAIRLEVLPNLTDKTEPDAEPQEVFLVSHHPELPSFGKVRQRQHLESPGLQWPISFACCFHTTENEIEITDWLISICKDYSLESRKILNDHFGHIHDALPGEFKAKEVKIYWNELTEKILIPYLLKNREVDIDDLQFTILSGEPSESSYQAQTIDFTYQLQFAGLERKKFVEKVTPEIANLCEQIGGNNFWPSLTDFINQLAVPKYADNPLMVNAYHLTVYYNLIQHLLNLKANGSKIAFDNMTSAEKMLVLGGLTNEVEKEIIEENEKPQIEEEGKDFPKIAPTPSPMKKNFDSQLRLLSKINSFGKVRTGENGLEYSDGETFYSNASESITNLLKDLTLSFTCCVHTTEKPQEILDFIRSICQKEDLNAQDETPYFTNLLTHLMTFQNLLPGENRAKEVKLYWNELAESTLFPYLLENESVDFNELVFMIIPGENANTPFQAAQMDFTIQLQFIGFGDMGRSFAIALDQVADQVAVDKRTLSEGIAEVLKDPKFHFKYNQHPILNNAYQFSLGIHFLKDLLKLKANGQKIDFAQMSPEEKTQLFESLLLP